MTDIWERIQQSSGLQKTFSTRIRLQVDSHNFGRLDISTALLAFNFEKSISEAGSLTISLAPFREWRDILAANDIVNIYVKLNSPGEIIYNRGWVRLAFAYINDVRANESVDSEGVFSVRFSISCTDFQKVAERTEIYNNPYLRYNEVFGNNFIGSYLQRMGVIDQGSPRFLIMNHLAALLGFGKQWLLPAHYDERLPNTLEKSFKQNNPNLAEFAASTRIKNDVLKAVQDLRDLAERYTYYYSSGKEASARAQGNIEAVNTLITATNIAASIATGEDTEEFQPPSPLAIRLAALDEIEIPENLPVQHTIDVKQPLIPPKTVYDILSFDYLEYADGFLLSALIWEHSGPLINLIRRDSHEVLNELIFDLRPTVDFYSGDTDGLGNDLDGGLAMVPCVILRERPFTTFPAIDVEAPASQNQRVAGDLSREDPTYGLQSENIRDRLVDVSGIRVTNEELTKLSIDPAALPDKVDWGGAVWLQQNRIVDYGPSVGINSEAVFTNALQGGDLRSVGLFNRGPRTLENIQITSEDVYGADLGRGDQDAVTGFDFIPTTELGEDQIFYQRDISPQFRHLLVRRHGLRMLMRTSEFSGPVTPGVGGESLEKIDIGPDKTGAPQFVATRQVAASFAAYMTLRVVTITDHWYQHNLEYLNGSIVLRPMPGLRAGYRIDWVDRDLSFYVEAVNQEYRYPELMVTKVQVTRGQPTSRPLPYIQPTDRVKGELSESAKLGINFPISSRDYEDSGSRRRVGPPPGYPGDYSPSVIWQNLKTAVHNVDFNVQFPNGINQGRRDETTNAFNRIQENADLDIDEPLV